MTRRPTIFTTLLLAGALAGCGNDPTENIGDVGVLGASLSDYAGSWEGYAEAFEFADGSDNVRVLLDDDGVGVIEVGDTAPLPEPDSTKAFPRAGTFASTDGYVYSAPFQGILAPGFSYPIEAAIVEQNRIRFDTASNELYREWCAGMEPVQDSINVDENGDPVYSCLPNAGTMFSGDQTDCQVGDVTVECGLIACIATCTCNADGCAVHEGEPDVRFDGALEDMGEALTGTLVMGDRLTLRLTRQ